MFQVGLITPPPPRPTRSNINSLHFLHQRQLISGASICTAHEGKWHFSGDWWSMATPVVWRNIVLIGVFPVAPTRGPSSGGIWTLPVLEVVWGDLR